MQQHTQSSKNKRGGARKGSGRKAQDVTKITITVPTEQVNDLAERDINRSAAYSAAMKEWLIVHKEKIDPFIEMAKNDNKSPA